MVSGVPPEADQVSGTNEVQMLRISGNLRIGRATVAALLLDLLFADT